MALYLYRTMLKYLFFIFLAFSLYQLVFKIILPIYRTTRQVKRSFREMQERMQAQANGQAYNNGQQYHHVNVNAQAQTQASTGNKGTKPGEYIEFEEITD